MTDRSRILRGGMFSCLWEGVDSYESRIDVIGPETARYTVTVLVDRELAMQWKRELLCPVQFGALALALAYDCGCRDDAAAQ